MEGGERVLDDPSLAAGVEDQGNCVAVSLREDVEPQQLLEAVVRAGAIVHRFETRTKTLPSRVYAKPFSVARGGRLDTAALNDQLGRLSYEEVAKEPESPGEFHRNGNDWKIYLRSAVTPQGTREALPVALDVSWRRLRRITHLETGSRLDSFSFEPEPLVTFYADVMEERRWTPLEEVPEEMILAIVAVEDRRFLRHHGIDLIGIGRAMFANVRAAGFVQGGSTITQQLAKNLYGPGKRSLRRKLLEAAAAVALELHYDKDELLGPDPFFMPDTECEHLELPLGCEWLITTPLTIATEDGIVTCAEEGSHAECMGLE